MATSVEALEARVTEFGGELQSKLSGFETFLNNLADDLKDNRREMRDLKSSLDNITDKFDSRATHPTAAAPIGSEWTQQRIGLQRYCHVGGPLRSRCHTRGQRPLLRHAKSGTDWWDPRLSPDVSDIRCASQQYNQFQFQSRGR